MIQLLHRAPWFSAILLALPACVHELASIEQEAGGGWDNNTAFWNEGLEQALVEILPGYASEGLGPNTLGPTNHVVFTWAPGQPSPCVALDPTVSAVRIAGSTRVNDHGVGPTLEVLRGTWAALPVGDSVDVTAEAHVEGTAPAQRTPVVLRIQRLGDVTRPSGSVRWPHYAVTMVRSLDCSAVGFPVGIFGPAPDLPGSPQHAVSELTASFALYASYYGPQRPSLLAKAAINFDHPLFMAGAPGTAAVGCTSGTPITGNRLAFLSAYTVGATVATYHPLDPQEAPMLVHMTKPGEPIKLHALQASSTGTEDLCHGLFAPPGSVGSVPIAKLAPPQSEHAEIDVIHAGDIRLGPLDRAASSYSWFAHGRSSARRRAFVESSLHPHKLALTLQATTAIAATRLGMSQGALQTWTAIRNAAIGRVDTLVAAETLPPAQASDAYDHEMLEAIDNPTCGDSVCGNGEVCASDCPIPVPRVGPLPVAMSIEEEAETQAAPDTEAGAE